jgi:hypothetical protein
MDQAATWFAGSILVTLGFLVIIAGVIVVNNLLHKYWKPVRIFTPDSWKGFNPPTYVAQEPVLEKDKK